MVVRVMKRILGVMNTTPIARKSQTETLAGRVAARVRALMAAQRKTTKDLAVLLSVSDRAAQRRRHGELEFSLSELEKVGTWLQVEPGALLSGRGLDAAYADEREAVAS